MLKGGRIIDPRSGVDGLYDVIVVEDAISAIERACMAVAPQDAAVDEDCILSFHAWFVLQCLLEIFLGSAV